VITAPITQLTFSDGTSVPVPAGGTVVIVGPNNSGKSVALRNIRDRLISGPREKSFVVTSLKVGKDGKSEELRQWLDSHCDYIMRDGVDCFSRPGANVVRFPELEKRWETGPPFRELGNIFTFFGAAEERLQAARGTDNRDLVNQAPTHPLHKLDHEPELERKIQEISRSAFGLPLTLNRLAGKRIYLHVGEVERKPIVIGEPEFFAYRDALTTLPLLEDQGDGMKSFIGLLLNMSVAHYPYVIVDEPEAFLHPPQATLLGRMMFDARREDSQLFLATHDVNILRGILEAGEENVTVIRITREGDTNPVKVLDSTEIRSLWSDPLLRYSEVLSGIFHQAVILCESDSDCRFYHSILDTLVEDETIPRRPEVLFTHCGGKHRMDSVARALNAVDVPVLVISDFDVLREEATIRGLVEAQQGDWSNFKRDWNILDSGLRTQRERKDVGAIKQRINELLEVAEKKSATEIDNKTVQEINRALKQRSRWDEAKDYGIKAIPQGEPSEACQRLLKGLAKFNIFPVPVGEIERFIQSASGHGGGWVADVHQRDLHRSAEANEAREFVCRVLATTE
jgi:hypothetical protein